ncbi:MAG: TetR family transcriptional regulator [Clostridia bacterium]|nr:TetR family transcriptional regulator [Clostridia bacterium]
MSKELMYVLIANMHIKLNKIIECNNFNLLNNDVQHYSRRLDRVLSRYNKTLEYAKKYDCKYHSYIRENANCLAK